LPLARYHCQKPEASVRPVPPDEKSPKSIIAQTRFLVVDSQPAVGEALRRFLVSEGAPAVRRALGRFGVAADELHLAHAHPG